MKAFYAETAPHQTVSLRVKKGDTSELVDVVLTPGKPCELPDDHPFTLKMIGAGFVTKEDGSEIAPGDITEELAALPKSDPQRLAAINTALDLLEPDDLTSQGQPKVSAIAELVGFPVQADEVAAAVKAADWKPSKGEVA